jgi:2-methylcitrate dehydratase PrpD
MVTKRLADYLAGALERPLPEAVRTKTTHHLLDTVAAMLSGTALKPGRLALAYAERQGGAHQAAVLGSGQLTTLTTAALVNGMLAHADETDDSHAPSLTHPGCAVVPAGLVMADHTEARGEALLRAVALGYDLCTRTNLAITPAQLKRTQRSTYSISGTFGAMAAAAALAGLSSAEMRFALSYAAQQASGLASWNRDAEHVEKAFVFAGMPARNGVAAVDMVRAGFTGVADVFEGETTFLGAFAPEVGSLETLVEGLGERYEIMNTNIKRWPVGSPIQAAVDSLMELMRAHDLRPERIASVTARLPVSGAQTVDDRHMPDINLQHLLAVTLLDGGLTFVASQDYARMHDEAVLALKARVRMIADPALNDTDPPRQAIVEVETTTGDRHAHRTYAVRGTKDNPMSEDEVVRKASDLLEPLLGTSASDELITALLNAHEIDDVRSLRPLLRVPKDPMVGSGSG